MKTFHQTPEEIIKAATPEQRILWNHLFLTCGERASISQLYYHGLAAGTEFLTYTAGKLYFALSLMPGFAGGSNANAASIRFYDRTNADMGYLGSTMPVWDATAAALRYSGTTVELGTCLFGRMVLSQYTTIKFIGYRINF